jgi:anti-sigma factor RsiW
MSHSTCKDSIGLMLEYLEGELQQEIKARLDEHLEDCTPCEEFLKSYRATTQLCRKALVAKMPEDVAAKLTGFLKAEMKKPSS